MDKVERTVVVTKKPIDDLIFEIVLLFREGVDIVIIKGYGPYISRAVDLYNILVNRMGESIELVEVATGSERRRGAPRSFIAIKVRRKY